MASALPSCNWNVLAPLGWDAVISKGSLSIGLRHLCQGTEPILTAPDTNISSKVRGDPVGDIF